MKADFELLLVDMNTKVAVVDVVVFFEQEFLRLQRRLKFQIVHVRAHVRLVWPLSLFSAHERVHVVPAVSADDEGHVPLLARELDDTRIALVVVGMRREKRVRIHASRSHILSISRSIAELLEWLPPLPMLGGGA